VAFPLVYQIERFEEGVVRHPACLEVAVIHPANDFRGRVVVPVIGVCHPGDACIDDCDRHQLSSR